MCAGALVLARIDRLIYGCDDPKTGAVKSLYNIVQDERLNHCIEVTSGILAGECSRQLQNGVIGQGEFNGRAEDTHP